MFNQEANVSQRSPAEETCYIYDLISNQIRFDSVSLTCEICQNFKKSRFLLITVISRTSRPVLFSSYLEYVVEV